MNRCEVKSFAPKRWLLPGEQITDIIKIQFVLSGIRISSFTCIALYFRKRGEDLIDRNQHWTVIADAS